MQPRSLIWETTMSDKNSGKKNDRGGAPKDLPAKPVDKKTDDKVKGGVSRAIKFDA